MKVIIAGSRDIKDYQLVSDTIHMSGFKITEVVSGRYRGVDLLGEKWAAEHNIDVKPFKAQWQKYGLSAGPIRNQKMAEYADALIAISLDSSTGTGNMIRIAREKGLPVYVKEL